MPTKILLGIIVLSVTGSISITAQAEPIALRNVSALIRDADLIVIGRTVSVSEKGAEQLNISGSLLRVRRMVAELSVNNTLKGRLINSHVWFAFFVSDQRAFKMVPSAQFAMFFLRQIGQEYVVLDPYYPFIVALPSGPGSEGNVSDAVVGQLLHVLTAPVASKTQRLDAIDALDTINTPNSTRALQRTFRSQDSTSKLLAGAALLRRNEITPLKVITATLVEDPTSVSESMLWKLSIAIENGVKDPRAIPGLSRLLRARDVRVRRAAAAGLRHTGAMDAISALSQALKDSDRDVRYQAVIGLAEITGQYEWGPSIDLFQRDENRYLTHWKSWAKTK